MPHGSQAYLLTKPKIAMGPFVTIAGKLAKSSCKIDQIQNLQRIEESLSSVICVCTCLYTCSISRTTDHGRPGGLLTLPQCALQKCSFINIRCAQDILFTVTYQPRRPIAFVRRTLSYNVGYGLVPFIDKYKNKGKSTYKQCKQKENGK